MVQEWRGTGFVKRDGVMLVVVGQDVDEWERSVDNDAVVNSGDNALAGRGGDECFCLGENGELESCEFALMTSSVLDRPLGPPTPAKDGVWSAVKGVKARDEDVREEE